MRLQVAGTAKTRSIRIFAILAVAAGLLVLAGCGSSNSTSSSASTPTSAATATSTSSTPAGAPAPAGAGSALSLSANPEGQLKYNTTSLTAKAGKVSIDFTNMSPLGHDVTVASSSGAVVGATPILRRR